MAVAHTALTIANNSLIRLTGGLFVASTVQVQLSSQQEPVLALDVVKFLTDAANKNEMKRRIWGENGISQPPGKVHALALQLLAAGFLRLYVKNESKLGKDNLSIRMIFVSNWERYSSMMLTEIL